MFLRIQLFSLLALLLHGPGVRAEDPREQLVREGIRQLRRQQDQNATNRLLGLAAQNQYIVFLDGQPGDQDYYYFKVRRNRGGDQISPEQAAALNDQLRRISDQGMETHLVVVNYLPVAIRQTLQPEKLTIETLLAKPAADAGSGNAVTVQQEFHAICNAIFGGALDPQGKKVYLSLGNVYALRQGQAPERFGTYYSRLNAGVNASFKSSLDSYIKAQGWSGTNAQRAQYLVDILAKAAYDYLGDEVDLSDWQTVTRRFKGSHTLDFLQAARQTMRREALIGHKKQLMQIAGLMEEMGSDTYEGYVQNIKATFSSKGYRTAQYNQWLSQTDALDAFAQGLSGYYDDVKNFRVKMWQAGITPVRMAQLMGGLPDQALQSLTAVERLQALKVLSGGELKDKWLFYGNNAENLAIALLRTAPAGQAADMHEGFTASSYALLAAMWPHMHDEGVGNLNYTAFVGQLCRFYYGQGRQVVQQAAKALPEDRLINWGSSMLKVRNYSVDDKNLGLMVFTSTRTDIRFQTGPETKAVFETTAELPVKAAAFEEIGIVMLSEPDQNLFPGAQKGQVYPVPALYFAYLVDKDHTDELKQALFGTLNMASFAIGIGELMTAKNALQVAWALANVAPPVVDLVLNTPQLNARIRQWEGGAAFLSAWEKVRTVTEVVLITKATIDVGRGFVLSFNKVKGRLSNDPGISPARYREMEAEVARVRQQCEGVGACFVAGTLVATAEGLRPIEGIRAGQKVQARDVFSGQTGYGTVRRQFVRQATQLVRLWVGGTLIEATVEHPFYINGHWLPAGQLQKGDQLTLAQGSVTASVRGDYLTPAMARVDSIAYLDTLVRVYNLEVAGFHTYFVGTQGVLVHNDCEDLLDGAGDVVRAGDGLSTFSVLFKNEKVSEIINQIKSGILKNTKKGILTDEEFAVIRYYTTPEGYRNFNRALRGEIDMTPFFQEYKAFLNASLEKLPIYNQIQEKILWRGLKNIELSKVKDMYKLDEVIEEKHFVSSAYDEGKFIASSRERDFEVILKIKAKSGRLIDDISSMPEEAEVLFKTNTKFKVKKVGFELHPDPKFEDLNGYPTIWTIELEEL
ncbi:MAG: hypothetical protein ICV83_12280 [Cytophagales bacterium]|nr:hypothetical protein [Cytophagales bacterium]